MSELELSAHAVHCAWYDVSELAEPALWERGMAALPWAARQEKLERFRYDKDKHLSLGAGLLAADLLTKAGVGDFALGYGEHGKPYLSGHPGAHFNISHSGVYAVCAVSGAPVGVDVEVVRDHGRAVAKRCFQARELAWMDGEPDAARAFTRLWVRKESYIKLIGTGLSLDPHDFSVLEDELPEPGIRFYEFELNGTLVCVCADGERAVEFASWQMAP